MDYPKYWSSKQRSSMINDAKCSLESGKTYLGHRKPSYALLLHTTQQRLDSDNTLQELLNPLLQHEIWS